MKFKITVARDFLIIALLWSANAAAQQRNPQPSLRAGAYDAQHEATLTGTVLNFTENSLQAPAGAHLSLQTAQGTVEVHLGSGSYLKENHFSIAAGDSIRLIGATISTNVGTVFLARMVQNGGHSIAVRSARGFPLAGYASRQSPQNRGAQGTREVSPQ
jgi:hypothetical protein